MGDAPHTQAREGSDSFITATVSGLPLPHTLFISSPLPTSQNCTSSQIIIAFLSGAWKLKKVTKGKEEGLQATL